MKQLNKETVSKKGLPVKVLQFGEGNFLRAFVDWMINKANKEIDFNRGVVVVQPLENGMVDLLKKQDNLYHVILEGIKDGEPIREKELIECIQDSINPYAEYEAYKNYFLSPDLELIVSNTTEAGITRVENEDINALPPKSFPGKVCQLLYQRYKHFNGAQDKGLTFFCCELIEKNATELRTIVLELAEENKLEKEFVNWLNTSCNFCSTLVDRIVTGFPRDTIKDLQKELDFEDNLVVIGEYFHLWAIEAPEDVRQKFAFDKAGLNVVWLDDMTEFRDKKVRILNGSHTALVPVGLLCGHQTVKEAFNDKDVADFILKMVDQEVIPNINGDKEYLKKFSEEILERFYNPYIKHYLKDISLNSLSKWMTRDYPSFIDCIERSKELPTRLTFSLAALLVHYKGAYNDLTFEIKDTAEHVDFITRQWNSNKPLSDIVSSILANTSVWGKNLNEIEGLSDKIASYIDVIQSKGIKEALNQLN